MRLFVEKPGMFTTVQDLGRYGCQLQGVPVAGAMDGPALRLGNILLGNGEGGRGPRGHRAGAGPAGRGGRLHRRHRSRGNLTIQETAQTIAAILDSKKGIDI